jgi:TonB family protein
MSESLIWRNLATYCLQVGLLIGLAAFVPTILRLRMPRAKLAYWHILLAACLILPLVHPWQQEAAAGDVQITSVIVAVQSSASASRQIPWTLVGLMALAGGILGRLIWLVTGFWRLRMFRRRSRPLEAAPVEDAVEFRISEDVSGPVTFGWRRPVVLLPAQFPELDRRMQDAILCHELLHVERNDWLFTLAEELVRAVFWFHPAIWWLLGEIQLAREQAVDREVIERTHSRDEYVDALLAIAGHSTHADLAPAPLFLKKRHLKQRVVSILKEVRMSRTKMISALAGGLGILAAACWFVTATFPLAAAPQSDAAGVTINLGGGAVLHRTPVAYPEAALAKGVQGDVIMEVKLDGGGNVSDARVVSGPDELRRAALESVLQWHFTRDSAGATRQVTIGFHPAATAGVTGAAAPAAAATAGAQAPAIAPRHAPEPPAGIIGRTVKTISFAGIPEDQQNDLKAKLPVHTGDTLTADLIAQTTAAVKEYDEHMNVVTPGLPDGSTSVVIVRSNSMVRVVASQNTPVPSTPAVAPDRIRVGGNVQQMKLVAQARPSYPPDAKAARIQGIVRLQAVIGKDGTVKELEVVSGHPLLVPSALEAVRQWVYQTTLLNGNPVEVVTQIDVNYTLSQ